MANPQIVGKLVALKYNKFALQNEEKEKKLVGWGRREDQRVRENLEQGKAVIVSCREVFFAGRHHHSHRLTQIHPQQLHSFRILLNFRANFHFHGRRLVFR